MAKGARSSGSQKKRGAGNPPPIPARRLAVPSALDDRMKKAFDYHGRLMGWSNAPSGKTKKGGSKKKGEEWAEA